MIKGGGERYMRILESTTTDVARREDSLAAAEIESRKQGQGLALFLALLCFGGAATFFALGNAVAGVAFLSLPVFRLIGQFIVQATKREQ